MPFKSEAQRRYMFARHPEIAEKWAKEGKAGIEKAIDGTLLAEYEGPFAALAHLMPDPDEGENSNWDSPPMEELTFKELAELMIAQGQLTVEEAEEFFGADLDDDDCAYESPGHQAATGYNPHAIKGEQQLRYLANERRLALIEEGPVVRITKAYITPDKEENDEKAFSTGSADTMPEPPAPSTGGSPFPAEDMAKAPEPGGAKKYISRHMTAGGNWKYNYPKTTASGEVASPTTHHSTVRPGRRSTGSAVQTVSVGGKNYAVLQHTKGDARKLNALREKGKVDVKD